MSKYIFAYHTKTSKQNYETFNVIGGVIQDDVLSEYSLIGEYTEYQPNVYKNASVSPTLFLAKISILNQLKWAFVSGENALQNILNGSLNNGDQVSIELNVYAYLDEVVEFPTQGTIENWKPLNNNFKLIQSPVFK